MLLHPVYPRFLTSFPFMTMIGLSFLPHSAPSPRSTTPHPYVPLFFPHALDPDFLPTRTRALPHCMPCLQHNSHANLKHFCLDHSWSHQSWGRETKAHLSGIWGRDFLGYGRLRQWPGRAHEWFVPTVSEVALVLTYKTFKGYAKAVLWH